jgi:hypothetical protein
LILAGPGTVLLVSSTISSIIPHIPLSIPKVIQDGEENKRHIRGPHGSTINVLQW